MKEEMITLGISFFITVFYLSPWLVSFYQLGLFGHF